MGKALLTDEMIEKASRGELIEDEIPVGPETKIMTFTDDVPDYYEDGSHEKIYKSRRIETAKRDKFQSKLNLFLFVLVILIALLIYAVFNL